MSDWMLSLLGPAVGGAVSGLMILAGLRVEVRALNQRVVDAMASAARAHVRLDDHIGARHV